MSLSDIKDVVTIAGVLIGAGSFVVAAYNTRISVLTNRARFWLDLRERFSRHDEVHRRLRPGGMWATGKGPETVQDWALMESYMGLFEHCEIMLAKKLIDVQTFQEIYSYRLRNIVANEAIRRVKLVELASGWQRFLALLRRMNIEVSK